MKVTLGKINASVDALRKVSDMELPIRIAYRIGKALSKISEEQLEFDKHRQKLFEKYGEKVKDDEGNETDRIQVPRENMEKFIGELEELLGEQVDIDAEPIMLDDLEDIRLTPLEMSALSYLFQE